MFDGRKVAISQGFTAEPGPIVTAPNAPSTGLGISHTGQAGARHRRSIADKRGAIG